jgi:hypothetical protein
MNQQTRRLLKVYLRLGWLKLHAYYEKLTSIAYAGSIVINPYRKTPLFDTSLATNLKFSGCQLF